MRRRTRRKITEEMVAEAMENGWAEKDIIQAIKKQMPKKTVVGNDNGKLRKSCGNCGCFILPASKFCSKCGQKIDWSD